MYVTYDSRLSAAALQQSCSQPHHLVVSLCLLGELSEVTYQSSSRRPCIVVTHLGHVDIGFAFLFADTNVQIVSLVHSIRAGAEGGKGEQVVTIHHTSGLRAFPLPLAAVPRRLLWVLPQRTQAWPRLPG